MALLTNVTQGIQKKIQTIFIKRISHSLTFYKMDKSVLSQVLKMKPYEYRAWVHQKATGNPKIRIFESDFLEFFSRWPWWYIFPMVTIGFLYKNPMSVVDSYYHVYVWYFIVLGRLYHLFSLCVRCGVSHLGICGIYATQICFPCRDRIKNWERLSFICSWIASSLSK